MEDTKKSPATQSNLGLILTGTVVSQRTEHKEWEGKKYSNHVIGISDESRTYSFLSPLKDGEVAAPVKMFSPIRINVVSTATDKGNISVRGTIAA